MFSSSTRAPLFTFFHHPAKISLTITATTFLKILNFFFCSDIVSPVKNSKPEQTQFTIFSIHPLGFQGNLGVKKHSELETVLIHAPQS